MCVCMCLCAINVINFDKSWKPEVLVSVFALSHSLSPSVLRQGNEAAGALGSKTVSGGVIIASANVH